LFNRDVLFATFFNRDVFFATFIYRRVKELTRSFAEFFLVFGSLATCGGGSLDAIKVGFPTLQEICA
jgi:hypothetical protein